MVSLFSKVDHRQETADHMSFDSTQHPESMLSCDEFVSTKIPTEELFMTFHDGKWRETGFSISLLVEVLLKCPRLPHPYKVRKSK